MLIGYARVSTGKQDLALQLDALERAGCERRFTDTASGALKTRPELQACLDHLRTGDTLVVWRLDRLGALAAAPDRHGRRAPGARRRVSFADRGP